VDGHFFLDVSADSLEAPRVHLPWPRVVLATALGIGGPSVVFEIRGLCWEALLASIVIVAFALLVIRLPRSVWLASVLIVGAFGIIGLIGWSGLRFHSLNVFSSYSSRLTYCGRTYQPEGVPRKKLPVTFTILTRHVEGVTPSGSAILGLGCQSTVLFVKSSRSTYQSYDLLGGP